MQYKNIPGTVLEPSVICMGSVQFCIENGEKLSFELMDTYVELGGNFIDTANVYGKWLPEGKNISEITIGKWFKEKGNRRKMILGTKGAHPHLSTPNISRLSVNGVAADLEESLKALQTDYIDLYWLHRDDETVPVGEIIEYLTGFVKKGKIRYFGCSNWKAYRVKEALQYAAGKGSACFAANQMLWNLASLNDDPFDDKTLVIMDEDSYQLHKEAGLTAIPYTSQANGLFEKLDMAKEIPLSQEMKRTYFNQENLNRFERVKNIADELSKSITEIVLGYLISQPFPTIPIIGSRTVEQVKSSMKAGELVLDEDVLNYLYSGVRSCRKSFQRFV